MLSGPERGKQKAFLHSMLELLVDPGGSQAACKTEALAPDKKTDAEVAANLFGDPALCDVDLD